MTVTDSGYAVLVVDDDQLLVSSVAFILRQEGYRVVTARTGAEALAANARERPQLILLDIGLPDMGGIEVCRRLRRDTDAPVIFLTARHGETDKVTALDAGADDYLTKPFGAAELAARARAVLRRSAGRSGLPAPMQRVDANGVTVDLAAHRVTVRGQEMALSRREFDLLHLLVAHAGRALSRQVIFDQVWGAEFFGDQNALDVYIRQLRRKIEQDPDRPILIETIRGVGYRFAPPDPARERDADSGRDETP
ncbi:MAG: response regulator transcription factor [Chloroflexi bacterium]|nr:response regulator transcription factor [Chloroflexota bacterium]